MTALRIKLLHLPTQFLFTIFQTLLQLGACKQRKHLCLVEATSAYQGIDLLCSPRQTTLCLSYCVSMGGRRFEGLSGTSIRRGSVWVDLLYRFKVRLLGDGSGVAPGTWSHFVISDASNRSAWFTAFLEKEKNSDENENERCYSMET